jgi:hypothetical protein
MNPEQPVSPVSYNSGNGSKNKLLITIILVVLLLASVGFGAWAFTSMQDYKNKTDQKIATAVEAAKKEQAAQLQTQFAQQTKSPYKVFQGSATYGSISFNYPKSWSVYDDSSSSSEPINAYFHPGIVPSTQSNTAYALRVELVNTDYAQVLQTFGSSISSGDITATAYVPIKLKGVTNVTAGVYLSGKINSANSDQKGYMMVIKVRDKTLQVYTQSVEYKSDFDKIVLASLKFVP